MCVLTVVLFVFILLQVCGITGRSYTYSRLRDHSAALSIRLHSKLKLEIGDVIAVCLSNMPEFPIATLGAIEAGLIVTTINPIYTSSKLMGIIEIYLIHCGFCVKKRDIQQQNTQNRANAMGKKFSVISSRINLTGSD